VNRRFNAAEGRLMGLNDFAGMILLLALGVWMPISLKLNFVEFGAMP
jgi:hypothetical protein